MPNPIKDMPTQELITINKNLRKGILLAAESLQKNGKSESVEVAATFSIPMLRQTEQELQNRGINTNHPSFGPNPLYHD